MLFAWMTHRLKMSHVRDETGHFYHRDTMKIDNTVTSHKCGSSERHLPALTRCYLLCFPSVQRSKWAHHTGAAE